MKRILFYFFIITFLVFLGGVESGDLTLTFFLGTIEGITEFLPISSTAHLILISHLFNIPQTDFLKFFEVFIQIGAISAVITNYFKFLLNNKILFKKLAVSLIPTIIFGIVFSKIIKNVFFESKLLIISMLILIGLIFILIELLIKKQKLILKYELKDLDYLQAFLIGIFQSLAIIPGVSRAGAVILGMLFLKFKREDSVLYSFFLAVPTIFLAGIYDLYKTGFEIMISNPVNLFHLSLGFLTSFLFASLTIKWFINYLQRNDLTIFGYYRIVLGLIFLTIFFLF